MENRLTVGASICIASGKDGTGKTQIATNLGITLSKMGVETLIVDGDIKGASIGLTLGIMDPKVQSIHDCLAGRIPPEKAIIESFDTHAVLGGMKINHLIGVSLEHFPRIIESYIGKFMMVIVDSPGGLGGDALMVISSCQSIILVLTPDLSSIIHAIKTLVLAKKVGSKIIGAIINRVGSPYDIPSDQIADFLRIEILGEIREDETVKKAGQEGVPAVMGHPKSRFSLEIKEIAKELIKRTGT